MPSENLQRDQPNQRDDPFNLNIQYVFCLPDHSIKEFTLFQGFSPGLLHMGPALRMLTNLPVDLDEPIQPREMQMTRRMSGAGSWQWSILNTTTFPLLPVCAQRPFWVLFSHDPDTAASIEEFAQKQPLPILHFSTSDDPSARRLSEASQSTVQAHVLEVLELLQSYYPAGLLDSYRARVMQWQYLEIETLPLIRRSHPITFPNHVVAESLGFDFAGYEDFKTEEENDYAPIMVESAKAILDLRDLIPPLELDRIFPRWPALILHVPSHNRGAVTHRFGNTNDPDGRALFAIQQIFHRQKGFLVPVDETKISKVFGSNVAIGAYALRQTELAIYAHLIALRAASTVSATIRLPPSVNRVFGTVAALGNHTRSPAPKRPMRMRRLLDTVQLRLRSAVTDQTMELIERSGPSGIKLIADAPLEWLPVRGLPLGLRYNVSRVGAIPGNQMAAQMFLHRPIRFEVDDLRRILIITSYTADDHIRHVLTKRLAQLSPSWNDQLDIEIVPVTTVEEFKEALVNFEGHIVVFDGHGNHPQGDRSFGTLMLAGKPVDVWDLRGEVVMPPIVILSACDTHGADRNQNTAANGFISCGARTVLGTLLPIDADGAGHFLAILLHWIAIGLTSMMKATGRVLLWSEVVGTAIKRKAAIDVCEHFVQQGLLKPGESAELSAMTGVRIVAGDVEWYEWQLVELAKRCQLPESDVKAIASQAIAASDAIRYIQMGNPESITIGSPNDFPDDAKATFLAENGDDE
ncbi:CHAT domain-containing protein [Rhizobium ruizarguesonis]